MEDGIKEWRCRMRKATEVQQVTIFLLVLLIVCVVIFGAIAQGINYGVNDHKVFQQLCAQHNFTFKEPEAGSAPLQTSVCFNSVNGIYHFYHLYTFQNGTKVLMEGLN